MRMPNGGVREPFSSATEKACSQIGPPLLRNSAGLAVGVAGAVDVGKGVAVTVGAGVWLAGVAGELAARVDGAARQAARLHIRKNASNRRAVMRISDQAGS